MAVILAVMAAAATPIPVPAGNVTATYSDRPCRPHTKGCGYTSTAPTSPKGIRFHTKPTPRPRSASH